MKIALIDGSPSCGKNAAYVLIRKIKHIFQDHEIVVFDLQQVSSRMTLASGVNACDAFIIVSPLMLDGLPAVVIQFMADMQYMLKKGMQCAAVVYDGMPGGRSCMMALRMVKCFAGKLHMHWSMGLGIGQGDMLTSMGKFKGGPFRHVNRSLGVMKKAMSDMQEEQDHYVDLGLPDFLYVNMSMNRWEEKAQKHGLKAKDLRNTDPAVHYF